MQRHRLSPEQASMMSEWEDINRHAWRLRKITGGALKLALLMSVEERLRPEVAKRIEYLQRKHARKI